MMTVRIGQLMVDLLCWVYMHRSTAGMSVCSKVLMPNIPKHYNRQASAIVPAFAKSNNTPTLQSLILLLSCMSADVWQPLQWS